MVSPMALNPALKLEPLALVVLVPQKRNIPEKSTSDNKCSLECIW